MGRTEKRAGDALPKSSIVGLEKIPAAKFLRFRAGNPRSMDDRAKATLKASLGEFGYVLPITVRKAGQKYEILNGHHRFDELVAAGETEIDALVVKVTDDQKAKALTLALNNISADWDLNELNGYVERFMAEGSVDPTWISNVTGFASKEVEALASVGTEFLREIDDTLKGFDVKSHKKEASEQQAGMVEDGMMSVTFKLTPDMNELLYRGIAAAKEKYGTEQTNETVCAVLRDFLGAPEVV